MLQLLNLSSKSMVFIISLPLLFAIQMVDAVELPDFIPLLIKILQPS